MGKGNDELEGVTMKKDQMMLLALLSFDDDYTLYKHMYFQRLYVGRYPVVIKIVDSAYDFVYEHVLVKRIQRSQIRCIAQDVKCRKRSTVPKFDDLTLLENGNSALFPDWSLEKTRLMENSN